MSGPDASYYIKAVFTDNTKSAATNTVSVMVYAQKKKAEEEESTKAIEFSCNNNPNPFNPETTINYTLPADCKVRLAVYNSIGQEVALLVDNTKSKGIHNAVFNAGHLSSGVYFYSLTAQPTGSGKDYQSNKKILLIK